MRGLIVILALWLMTGDHALAPPRRVLLTDFKVVFSLHFAEHEDCIVDESARKYGTGLVFEALRDVNVQNVLIDGLPFVQFAHFL